MRIYIKAVPNASSRMIEEINKNQFKARLCSAPAGGKANEELIKMLAKHFRVAKSQVEIVGGKTAREKIVDITN